MVFEAGLYDFEMEADDGARITIGNGITGEIFSGDYDGTMNVKMSELSDTARRERGEDTFGKQCPLCASGTYGDCFVTTNGCEPFQYWRLEADGASPHGKSTSCNTGTKIYKGQKWMPTGKHPIKVEYFQRGGDGVMALRWKGPDSGGNMLPIGGRNFFYPKFSGVRTEVFQDARS